MDVQSCRVIDGPTLKIYKNSLKIYKTLMSTDFRVGIFMDNR